MTTPTPPLTEAELTRFENALCHLDSRVGPGLAVVEASIAESVLGAARRALALESELAQLRRGVVANAGRLSSRRLPRWAHVRDAIGVGSTSARQMCRDAGFEPEEPVGDP